MSYCGKDHKGCHEESKISNMEEEFSCITVDDVIKQSLDLWWDKYRKIMIEWIENKYKEETEIFTQKWWKK